MFLSPFLYPVVVDVTTDIPTNSKMFNVHVDVIEDDEVWDVVISDGEQTIRVEFQSEKEAETWASRARRLFEDL